MTKRALYLSMLLSALLLSLKTHLHPTTFFSSWMWDCCPGSGLLQGTNLTIHCLLSTRPVIARPCFLHGLGVSLCLLDCRSNGFLITYQVSPFTPLQVTN